LPFLADLVSCNPTNRLDSSVSSVLPDLVGGSKSRLLHDPNIGDLSSDQYTVTMIHGSINQQTSTGPASNLTCSSGSNDSSSLAQSLYLARPRLCGGGPGGALSQIGTRSMLSGLSTFPGISTPQQIPPTSNFQVSVLTVA